MASATTSRRPSTWIYILQTRPESKVNVYKVETKF